jgi:nicotinate phosphoribosyltransferase
MGPLLGLLTDRYELTMLDAALRSGAATRRAVFETHARALPAGRRFGVFAGTGRLTESLQAFAFADDDLEWLLSKGIVTERAAEWLAAYRFSGHIDAYREGEPFFPGSPVLTVEAPFAEALVLETILLSTLNFDTAVATTAARIAIAAGGRTLIEMGSRRTHEAAAVAAARAAYLGGFDATSNLAAGRRYGVPTTGTVAHAFVLAHRSEEEAFAAQVALLGADTTLLVDTFDLEQGIRTAVAVASPALGAIRIDSGDLANEARRARTLLNELGATSTRIVLSGELDETRITELVRDEVPVDAFGVGTKLVTGPTCPSPGFVYKLVAIADEPGPDAPLRATAKRAAAKATVGGRKRAWRLYGPEGRARADVVEVLSTGTLPVAGADRIERAELDAARAQGLARELQVPLVREGKALKLPSLQDARAYRAARIAELPAEAQELSAGPPCLPTRWLLPDASTGT